MVSISEYMNMECIYEGSFHGEPGSEFTLVEAAIPFHVEFSAQLGTSLRVTRIVMYTSTKGFSDLFLRPFGMHFSGVPEEYLNDVIDREPLHSYTLRVGIHRFKFIVPPRSAKVLEGIPPFFRENLALVLSDEVPSPYERLGLYVGTRTIKGGYKPMVKSLGCLESVDILDLRDVVEEAPNLRRVGVLIINTERGSLPDFLRRSSIRDIYLRGKSGKIFDMKGKDFSLIRMSTEGPLLKNLRPNDRQNSLLQSEVSYGHYETEYLSYEKSHLLEKLWRGPIPSVVENIFNTRGSGLLRRVAEYRLENG